MKCEQTLWHKPNCQVDKQSATDTHVGRLD